MSVITRTEGNPLLLFCKGADSVIFERLSGDGKLFVHNTNCHISEYSESGLRTLDVAYCALSAVEYLAWYEDYLKAKNSVNANHDSIVDEVADRIETDLILLGATAVNDKLHKGVPECIDKLAQPGIMI